MVKPYSSFNFKTGASKKQAVEKIGEDKSETNLSDELPQENAEGSIWTSGERASKELLPYWEIAIL